MTDDALREHLCSNAQLVEVLGSHGDQHDVPREVEHLALFRRKGAAEAAAAELSAAGFRVSPPQRRMLTILLEFSRTDAVDLATADRFTEEIHTIAIRHGGTYDGWSCMVQDQSSAT